MKYIPQSPEDRSRLLRAIGLNDTEELFKSIPSSVRLTKTLPFPKAQSEIELRRSFSKISKLGTAPTTSFAGCGVYQHDIPSIVPFLQSRSEYATAYTPYQPELSQGLLQAIFEYQTMACQLTDCELSNASLFDGATSLAEGVLMALRIKKKTEGKILISGALHPSYKEVLDTYCSHFKNRFVEIPLDGDFIDLKFIKDNISEADIVVTQSPNIFGVIEKYSELGKLIKGSDTLWVTSTMEPLSWAVLKGPGAFGAHIVTGEGQSFGNAPYMGGSSFGIFCTKQEYLRQLPGRLVGETVDADEKRSYVLTFVTREQFVRRGRATSNICTNQNLNMLGGLFYLSTLGKNGLRQLAEQNLSLCEYAKSEIKKIDGCKVSDSPTFNEFVVETKIPAKDVIKKAQKESWVCGVDLGRLKEEWKHKLLIHVSELHQKSEIDQLIKSLG
jgi:glycine dehydrogenase subunit 1